MKLEIPAVIEDGVYNAVIESNIVKVATSSGVYLINISPNYFKGSESISVAVRAGILYIDV